MKMDCSKAGWFLSGIAWLVTLAFAGGAWANTSNSIPSTFSFEGHADGTLLAGINGWYGAAESIRVVAAAQPYGGEKPLPDPHAKLARLLEPVLNAFDGDAAETNVWVDMLIQPNRRIEVNPPDTPSDAQTVIYFDTNGYLNAYCSFWTGAAYTNTWATFGQVQFATSQWIRLTIALAYNVMSFGEDYFQLRVDSGEGLTNFYGQTNAAFGGTGGSWLYCANRSINQFNSFALEGSSYLDDVVVTNGEPSFPELATIRVIADPGTTITPPGPNEIVLVGTNKAFTIGVNNGYELTNVAWGVGLGPQFATNSLGVTFAHTFTNVQTDLTFRSFAAPWVGPNADMGTSIAWLQAHGLTNYPSADDAELGNDDSDPKLNWEEYVTGTDPTNELSYFSVVDQGYGSPSNRVVFFGTTDSGVFTPFSMYRSMDLNFSNMWIMVETNSIARDPTGTNTWWDVNAPSNEPAHYYPAVIWTN